MDRVDEPDSERGARAQPGPRRQVAVVMNLETFAHLEPLEHAAHRRMLDLANVLNVFDDRVDHTKLVLEERRQLSHADVAVLINGGGEHGAAVLAIPLGIVSAAAEKRDAKRSPADDHSLSRKNNSKPPQHAIQTSRATWRAWGLYISSGGQNDYSTNRR